MNARGGFVGQTDDERAYRAPAPVAPRARAAVTERRTIPGPNGAAPAEELLAVIPWAPHVDVLVSVNDDVGGSVRLFGISGGKRTLLAIDRLDRRVLPAVREEGTANSDGDGMIRDPAVLSGGFSCDEYRVTVLLDAYLTADPVAFETVVSTCDAVADTHRRVSTWNDTDGSSGASAVDRTVRRGECSLSMIVATQDLGTPVYLLLFDRDLELEGAPAANAVPHMSFVVDGSASLDLPRPRRFFRGLIWAWSTTPHLLTAPAAFDGWVSAELA